MISIQHNLMGTVCRLSGEVDASNVDGVRLALDIARSEPLVVIDLSDVTFMDSAGLEALIGAVHRADQDGNQIAVACDEAPLLRLFQTVGLDRIVLIATDATSALDALTAPEAMLESRPTQRDARLGQARSHRQPATPEARAARHRPGPRQFA